jgi:hypothetical protein
VDCRRWLLAGLAVACLSLTGCETGQGASAQGGDEDRPATVTPIEGGDLHRVTLTSTAADRAGIKTEPVRAAAAPDGSGQSLVVPVGALVYDNEGQTWVYVSTQPLTYVRERVTVTRIDGDTAVLQSGPAAGTPVASVGAAELLGAENGVEGE